MKFKRFILESTDVKFEIPKKLKKILQITDSLSDVKNWKAKTILGNNGGDKGKFHSVGYIGISLDSNIIVPISRKDEHQNGHDYIDYLIDKDIIPKGKYYSLYALGNNYIYGGQNKKYIEDALIAYKKWLSYGGSDLSLKGSGILYTGHISDFINRINDITVGGDVDLNVEGIFPKGQNLINEIREIAIQYKQYLDIDEFSHAREKLGKTIVERIEKFVNEIDGFSSKYPERMLHFDKIKKLENRMKSVYSVVNNTLQNAISVVFGMDGIKNSIHTSLKNILVGKKPYVNGNKEYFQIGFGDVRKAKIEFDKMGNI